MRFARFSARVVVAVLALAGPVACVTACTQEKRPTADTSNASTVGSNSPAATGSPVSDPGAGGGEVTVGKPPPDFTAKAHDGVDVHLAALKGKPVVLYFYPKDETPGCTKEACSFRDAWEDLSKKGVVLIGISGDDDASHKKFAEHHKLPFHLVSDPDGKIAKQFGVPFTAGFAGRQTFVIDAAGNVKKIYRTVDVTTHAKEIAGDVG